MWMEFSGTTGNATGVHMLTGGLDPKKLGLLRELAPHATLVGVLPNPNVEDFQFRVTDVQEAARTVGLQIHVLRATTDREIDAAFAALSGIRAGALVLSQPEAIAHHADEQEADCKSFGDHVLIRL